MPECLCHSCPLWERYQVPGVPRQIVGYCRGPQEIKHTIHRPTGMGHTWPLTFQDDWCDHHPKFDKSNPKLDDEPFWPAPPQHIAYVEYTGPKPKESRKQEKKLVKGPVQGKLF